MRGRILIPFLIMALFLAGCTQPSTTSDMNMDGRSMVAEGNALVYQNQTAYIRSSTESGLTGTLVVEDGASRQARDFRVNTTTHTISMTSATPLDQYPPASDYQTIDADYGHPFILYTLTSGQLDSLITAGTTSINGQTIRRMNGTGTYRGQETFRITTGTVNMTVRATEPYLVLRTTQGNGHGLLLQDIRQQRFQHWTSDPTESGRNQSGTATAFYIDTRAPSTLTAALQDWALFDEVRRGDSYDVVATGPAVQTQTQRTAVRRLLRNGSSLGVYLPIPRGTITLGGQTYDIAETRGLVRINDENYIPENVQDETGRFRARVEDGEVRIYARIYGSEAIQGTGKIEYASQNGRTTFRLPMTISTDAAERFQRLLRAQYNRSGGQITLDDEPVQMHIFTAAGELTSMQVAASMSQGPVQSPQIRGRAPDLMTARFRAGIIQDSLRAGALPGITLVQPGTTGRIPSRPQDAGPQVSFTDISPADGATVEAGPGEYSFTIDANRDGRVRVMKTRYGNERLLDSVSYDTSKGSKTFTVPAEWTAGSRTWRLVFKNNGQVLKETTATFNVTQMAETGSLTAGEPVIGQQDAPVTMVYWTDYACRPYCQEFSTETLPRLVQNEVANGSLRIVFKEAPLRDSSMVSAEAAYCAAQQAGTDGQLFKKWHKAVLRADVSKTQDQAGLVSLTGQVDGIDAGSLESCLANNDDARSEVQTDRDQAWERDMNGAPVFLLYADSPSSGISIIGARSYSHFQENIGQVR